MNTNNSSWGNIKYFKYFSMTRSTLKYVIFYILNLKGERILKKSINDTKQKITFEG
jgi:hypothetical protein